MTNSAPRPGRPKKAPHEQRSESLPPLRVTAAERAHIEAQAAAAGLPVSEYRRRAELGERIEARATPADEAALAQLGRVAGNLAQIVRHLNYGRGIPSDLAETVAAVKVAANRIAGEGGR